MDLREEVTQLARKIEESEAQHRRQVDALKFIADGLRARMAEESSGQSEEDRLNDLEEKIADIELEPVEPAPASKAKPAAASHAPAAHATHTDVKK
jgi:hypothetical protein